MAECPSCRTKISYSLIGSRPMRRQYTCKNCAAKLEVTWSSYFFRLAEVLTVSSLSVFFSFIYSTFREAVKREAGLSQPSLVFFVLLLTVLFPVDYLVWRYVVKLKKAR